jgi:hypothetical protein
MSLEMEEYVSDQMPEDMQKIFHLWICTLVKMKKFSIKGVHFRAIRIFSHICCDTHVRWVSCHHGMVRPQVVVGGDALQLWREAANILIKQLQTADKGWSSSFGVGHGSNNS